MISIVDNKKVTNCCCWCRHQKIDQEDYLSKVNDWGTVSVEIIAEEVKRYSFKVAFAVPTMDRAVIIG